MQYAITGKCNPLYMWVPKCNSNLNLKLRTTQIAKTILKDIPLRAITAQN